MQENKVHFTWSNFEKSGRISDYLLFKSQMQKASEEGKSFDGQNVGNRFSANFPQFTGQTADHTHL